MSEYSCVLRPDLDALIQFRAEVLKHSQSDSTRRAYARDWKQFHGWCAAAGRAPFPASSETAILYLTDCLQRERKINTVTRYASAIYDYHRAAKIPGPDKEQVRMFLAGARRLRCEQVDAKAPLTIERLRVAVGQLGKSPLDVRNRAILVLGFASALRRSNLVALDWPGDVHRVPEGLVLVIRKSKTDQQGEGKLIGVKRGTHPDTCPVTAIEKWLEIRGEDDGPLFLAFLRNGLKTTGRRLGAASVCRIVKEAVGAVGFAAREFGAHSLRSGFVTTAVENGVNQFVIASQTGHRSLSSLQRYYRVSDPLRNNASGMIGL